MCTAIKTSFFSVLTRVVVIATGCSGSKNTATGAKEIESVELDSGQEKDSLNVSWVDDESWSTPGECSTSSEQNVSVKFFECNGGLEFAWISQDYRASENGADFSVLAYRFDVSLFDADHHGVENFVFV